MLIRLFLVLVTIPLLETTLLLYLANRIGLLATIGMVIGTGILGTWLLRWQGLGALTRIREQVQQGRLPATELLDGAMILVAGVLLLTPGILTDLCGVVVLVPWSRDWVRRGLVQWFKSRWHLRAFVETRSTGGSEPQRSQVIDSYVVRSDDEHPGSGGG